ncbi:MAG: MFS transporter [Promethearchaeota archaeon]|nr:MAG: MFS transporter [Candidatus Lokiarchaeota archaeon]
MESTPTKHTFTHYLFFWAGQLFSLLGSSIIRFAIFWWINIETLNPIIVSIALFLGSLPMVIIPPLVGVFIDRWNRKITIAIVDSLQAFITFLIFLFFITGIANVWLIITMNIFRGICQAIHFPTVNAIIPLMIPKKHLSRMNAINYLFTGVMQIIGPAVGAILLTFFEIEQILWIDIFTFFIAIVPLIFVVIPSISPNSQQTERTSFFKDFKYSLNILKKVRSFLILIIFISVINLLNMPFNTQMALFVVLNHSGGKLDYGLILSFFQIGIVVGAIIASTKKHWKHKELIILYSVFIGIGGYLITTLAPKGFFLLMGIGSLIHASMIPIANTMFLTILQTKVPPETQGRVFSIVASIAAAVTPLGMLISGPLAVIFGIPILFIIVLYLQFVSVVITWYFTDLKKIIHEESRIEKIEKEEEIRLRPEQIEL